MIWIKGFMGDGISCFLNEKVLVGLKQLFFKESLNYKIPHP